MDVWVKREEISENWGAESGKVTGARKKTVECVVYPQSPHKTFSKIFTIVNDLGVKLHSRY